MKSKIIISLLIILLIPLTSAQTVDAEISHLIGYAEQYEMGNIDYLELLIQGSLTRNKVNKILGSFNQEERGPSGITADAAEQFFGVPKGYTKQAWSSSTDKNTKLEEEVPWFEKILFDGKRIQMSFNAWPHIYENNGEQTLYYWTDFQIRYKKELTLDMDSTLAEIESSGNAYLQGAGSATETTALVVAAEREISQYVNQNKANCESVMNDIFPSGALQSNEKSERWNIEFFEGENMEVTLTVSMPECSDTCQWPWINLWFNPRSDEPMDFSGASDSGEYNRESFIDYTIEQLEAELTSTLEEIHTQMERIDQEEASWDSLTSYQDKMQALNEALSEKYYNHEGPVQNNKEDFEKRKSQLQNILGDFGSIETETVQERRYEQRLATNTVEHQDAWCQNTNEETCNVQEEACIAGACTYALGGLEDCENGIDDDGDTVVDCSDPDCAKTCGKFCQNVCGGDCGECRNNCFESSCQECWTCDRTSGDEYCNEICESSGCNTCNENCRQQSVCAECTACEDSLQTLEVNDCMNECSPCTECRVQYESSEEADINCAQTCDPCTICKAPSVNAACYQTCDEISTGMQNEVCSGLCADEVLFVCNGQQQYSPCADTTYICDGIQQPFPCTIYSCQTEAGIQKQTVPCGQEFCGENQVLEGSLCVCKEGFSDCDGDGTCTDMSSCGEKQEICTDGIDNDEDQLFDCQDISACETQSCGENSFCHEGSCLTTEELAVCAEGETLQEGMCRKLCTLEGECTENEFCSYGYCTNKKSCTAGEECSLNQECTSGFCENILEEQDPLETGQSCTLESDCAGERDICSNGVCKEIPEENYNQLVDEGLLIPINEETERIQQESIQETIQRIEENNQQQEEIQNIPQANEEQITEASITGFIIWATDANAVTGKVTAETCTTDEDCADNQGCDTFRGECYCKDTFFDCNEDGSDGCETSDPTCGGTRELCGGGCGLNQYCDEQRGNCQCTEGFSNCDGIWWDCESEGKECPSCTSNEDCATPTCAPYDNAVVMSFGCFKGSTWQEDKGALSFSGGCTSFPNGQVESWIHFDTWGEPFDELNQQRSEIENSLGSDWCVQEKEDALRQRAEIEYSLTDPEFIENIFAGLLTEDTKEWETNIEAIHTMYWSIVENTRQLARSSQCLDEEFPTLTPLELEYEFEGGGIKIWEEPAYAEEFEREINTPYMKLGIFPPKELVKEEFKNAAIEGHFPGEEGEQSGPSVEELEELRSSPEAMDRIRELTEKYEDGSLDTKITINEGDESLFIVDFSISEENLFQVKPVINYEKEADLTIEIDFDFIYGLISTMEKDGRVEHPEWIEDSLQENIGGAIDAGVVLTKITAGFASGDISVSPISELGTAMDVLKMMFRQGP